jgi:DNA polymerase III subunit epsilon
LKALYPFIGVMIVIGLIVKFFWWIVAISAIVGLGYIIWRQAEKASPPKDAAPTQVIPHAKPAPPVHQPRQTRAPRAAPRTAPSTRPSATAPTAPTRPIRQPQRADAQKPTTKPTIIHRSLLTRVSTGINARDQIFTAVDLETTGLFPSADRIVEIGLVKFRGSGEIIDEFATLVNNPGSSAEARSHHQIDDADLIGAPTIDRVLPEVFAFIAGTVVVAHNLEFEEGFLAAAAQRNALSFPRLTGLCTLLAARRQLDGRAYSLLSLYKTATGEWPQDKHTALGDARAVRELLLWMLRTAPQPLHLTAAATPVSAPVPAPRPCDISCRPMPMGEASIAALLASFPQSPMPRAGDAVELERYRALLGECVKDGRLTFEEATSLSSQARRTRVNGSQLRSLHRDAWLSAFGEDARRDWTTLTGARRREMWLLADALGFSALADEIEAAIQRCAEPTPLPQARYLRGVRVGILGRGADLDGLRVRAEQYGASVAVRITKTVIWAATATPDANDAAHRAARTYQVPILTPAAARRRLDDAISGAQRKDLERQRAVDSWAAERKARDDYWRPTWRPTELDYDPEPVRQNY